MNTLKWTNPTLWFLIGIALFISWQLIPLIDIFLGAIILYVLLKPVHHLLTEKLKFKNWISSLLLILVTLVLVFGPAYYTLYVFYQKLSGYINQDELTRISLSIDTLTQKYLKINLLSSENIRSIQGSFASLFTDLVSESLILTGNLALLCFLLFFMLIYTGRIEKEIALLVPLEKNLRDEMSDELKSQVYSNVLGAPLLATLQGIVATLGYYFLDLPDPVFYGIATGIMSFIPTVGSALIWGPAGLWLMSMGKIYPGLFLLLFGVIVISSVDNVFRFVMQKKLADVHPVITILGLIIGIKAFGLSGIIFGPLLLSFFLILLKAFRLSNNPSSQP